MADVDDGARAPIIEVMTSTTTAKQLWATVASLSRIFGRDEPWVLVGGLMVQLFSFEYRALVRPTIDIDVLGDARKRSMTKRMSEAIIGHGGELLGEPSGQSRLAYEFGFRGATVEVLAPDGLRSVPRTVGRCTTIEVPGGTQALRRAEVVRVSVDGGRTISVRRPTLIGAILMKARVVTRRRDKFESDRHDLIRLLGFVRDPREKSRQLSNTERG